MKTSISDKPNQRGLGRCLIAGVLGILGAIMLLGSFGRVPEHSSLAIPSTADATPKYVTKQIQNIQEGDVVLARDEFGDEVSEKRVVEIYRNTSDHLRILEFESADGIRQTLKTTDEHPFWDSQKADYIAAKDLKAGDEVVGPNGEPSRLVSSLCEPHPEGIPVFNFQVEDAHTYYVKANGINAPPVLVHNSCVKRGPKLDPNAPHNATIRAQADLLKAAGNKILAGGGKAKEKLIRTLGGIKSGRRPDILFETPDGQIRGRNIGLTNAAGDPIKRELEALQDLNRFGGIPTDFVPYD